MGSTADLAMVQKMIIDTLHKESKSQRVITERGGCSRSAVSKHIKCKVDWRTSGGCREQSVGRVAGVFDNPPGFPCTPPGVDILEGGKLTSNNVAGSSHDPLQSPAVASVAVSKPGGDAAGQDALHSAGVEGSEDAGARSKLPQPSQEEETLMCLLQHCICVSRPCEILGDVNAEVLKAVYPLHGCLVDGDGCVFSSLSPVIHQQLLL